MDVGNDAASGYANTSLNADPAELVPPRADATRLPAAAIPLRCSAAPTAFSRLPLPLHARVMLVPAGQAQKNGKVTESQRAKIRGSTRVSCKEQGAVRPPLLSPAPPLTALATPQRTCACASFLLPLDIAHCAQCRAGRC